MQKEILHEIKELKAAIAQLIGTSDLLPEEQFSRDALNKAAKQFQKLSTERGEWIGDEDIDKYIKNADYRPGNFIIKEFGFTNYYKKGHYYYFNKKDIVALAKELKERNINLGRYMDYVKDQASFKKSLEKAAENKNAKKMKKAFRLPNDLKEFESSPVRTPDPDIIREDIKRLKEDFFQLKLDDYVDIYKGNYGMMKHIYWCEKYLEPGLKKRCRKWCDDFNYANHALEVVTKKKEIFIPVQEEDMIEL
jgi:hypothetical protein